MKLFGFASNRPYTKDIENNSTDFQKKTEEFMKLDKSFLWGGATADFQVEGGYQEGGRGLSTLPDGSFGETRSSFFNPEDLTDGAEPHLYEDRYYPSHKAVDFYHHYKEDIALMAGMGYNVYRFSICWSRIFPTGEETVPNEEGLKFYQDILDELAKYGMEPMITIYHDELPAALAIDYDGWSSRHTIDRYINTAASSSTASENSADTGLPSTKSTRSEALQPAAHTRQTIRPITMRLTTCFSPAPGL